MALFEAVKVRLDPTPRQARLLESHAGAARFAYNLMLNHVQDQLASGEAPDWTMYAMRRWWNRRPQRNANQAATSTGGVRLGAGLGNETMQTKTN